MTQQVEVRLANGGSEVFSASGWFGREDGGLDVLSADNSVPLATIATLATFARGEWAFVSKVVIETSATTDELRKDIEAADDASESEEILRKSIAENLEDLAAKELWRDRGGVPGMKAAAYMIRNGLV